MTCPSLARYTIDKNDYTLKETFVEASTQERTAGTIVKLSCREDYVLTPNEPTILCQSGGKWNYTSGTQPDCLHPNPNPFPTIVSPSGLTSEQRIIVGVASGVGGLCLVLILIFIFVITQRRRQYRREKKQVARDRSHRSSMRSASNFVVVNNSRQYATDSFGRNVFPSRSYTDDPMNDRRYPGRAFQEDIPHDSISRNSDFRYPDYREKTAYSHSNDRGRHNSGGRSREFDSSSFWDNPTFDRRSYGDEPPDYAVSRGKQYDARYERDQLSRMEHDRLRQIDYAQRKTQY